MEVHVEVRSLAGWDGRTIISGSKLVARAGEIVALVGPNGSGKTMLLKAIAGLLPEDVEVAGTVRLKSRHDGEKSAPLGSSRTDVTYLSQSPVENLVFRSIVDELGFGSRCRGTPEEKVREAVASGIDRFELAALLDRETFRLSPGQQQRVAIAEALVRPTSILLLDEPEAFLDDRGIVVLEETLLELAKSHNPPIIAIATHQVARITRWVDEIWHIAEGRIRKISDAAEYAASFDENIEQPANMPSQITRGALDVFTAEEVCYAYGDALTLIFPDLVIGRGDLLKVHGGNGVGKSTFLRLLSGAWKRPRSGSIKLNGKVVHDTRVQWPHDIFLVLQDPVVHVIGGSIDEEVSILSRSGVLDPSECAFLIALYESIGLRRDQPIKLMSFGQRKLVSLAPGMLTYGVLLIDEGAAGLDPRSRAHLELLVNRRREAGAGVVTTSANEFSMLGLDGELISLDRRDNYG